MIHHLANDMDGKELDPSLQLISSALLHNDQRDMEGSTERKVLLTLVITLMNCQLTCVPIFPSLLQTYLPRNPVLPKTVATTPLKLDLPPVPFFKAAKFVVLIGRGVCEE